MVAGPPGPVIRLTPAQASITVPRFGNQVLVDPGIWVASLGSSLRFDVSRASYTRPVTTTQVISRPGRPPVTRHLPASVLDGWNGLKRFVSLTVRDKTGKVVGSRYRWVPGLRPDGCGNQPAIGGWL
jgi:hypothetical protein